MTAPPQPAICGPVGFARAAFGHDPWGLQAEIMEAVAAGRKTAVKSCHSSGKTKLAAWLVLWWLVKHKKGIALTTAPGWLQVEKLLWGEIRDMVANSPLAWPTPNLTELKLSDTNYALGLSTNESTRFQGFKAEHILIVLDEATGVSPAIWEAIQGLRASGRVHILAIGNPTVSGGDFGDAFTTKRHLWRTFTISAFDTPNLEPFHLRWQDGEDADGKPRIRVVGRGAVDLLAATDAQLDALSRPYLCAPRWVREMFEEWGPTHPFFESRVLGAFPTQGDDVLVPLAWLERARAKEPPKSTGRLRAGLDVAGPGEAETVLAVMDGDHVVSMEGWPQADTRGVVVSRLLPLKDRLVSINVDSAGTGYERYLSLKDAFGEIVHAVNVGEAARDPDKFVNLKAEHYWALRMGFQDGDVTLSPDMRGEDVDKLLGQLTAIRYKHNARGKVEIEKKEDMRKRGVKSPDRAEALMLANAVHDNTTERLFPLIHVPRDGAAEVDPSDEVLIERRSPWRF